MHKNRKPGWHFVDQEGTFALPDADRTSYLYFPLVNENGMVSVVTPTLHGDIKTDHDTFLTLPVSTEDLHISRAARNVWVRVEGQEAWSATGNSAAQVARRFAPEAQQVHLKAGFLWHHVARTNPALGLRAEITSFVPSNNDAVELMGVVLTNVSSRPIPLTVTTAIPIYGRSADRLRDHRHVTSLLQRIRTHPYGVLVCPSLTFDERGHRPNDTTYVVLGAEADSTGPREFFPVLADFVGEGGTLDWPEAVVDPRAEGLGVGAAIDGYEAMGGLRFRTTTLAPGERCAYVIILGILDEEADPDTLVENYGSWDQFHTELERTKAYWERKLAGFRVDIGDARFNGWTKWVALQPSLRRICGNSFLPYHDYGRGGRGWRDLWQDLLALLLMDRARVDTLLLGNFAGVRIDGSNATIVGTAPGEFKADRNNIPRVWMDHGAWPLLATQLYIDQTGDLAFLLHKQAYFRDKWVDRGQGVDVAWEQADGTVLRTANGSIYRGTVLEHLLVQHLTVFFNVGEHNIMRLEDGDWNDGLDMARENGESVAFTALYAGNLRHLGQLVKELASLGATGIALAGELGLLLDTVTDPVDYGDPTAKQERLARYFEAVRDRLSGEKVAVSLGDLASDILTKAGWLTDHLQRHEWVEGQHGYGWFNGYYDEEGRQLEGWHGDGIRMTLTGQTFALMGDVATAAQASEIVRSVDRYLSAPEVGGPRLNTDIAKALPDGSAPLSATLGRAFGFAFGHKENGAMFSHMAVMYANALYRRGLARAGHRVLDGIYRHSQDFAVSRMYPGIPEYVNPRGRGMYPYLTGSASWYLLTIITQVFGVKGLRGDLVLEPKLLQGQFDESGRACIRTLFAGKLLDVAYINSDGLDYPAYWVGEVRLNDAVAPFERAGNGAMLRRGVLERLRGEEAHRLEVVLTRYEGDDAQEDDDTWA